MIQQETGKDTELLHYLAGSIVNKAQKAGCLTGGRIIRLLADELAHSQN